MFKVRPEDVIDETPFFRKVILLGVIQEGKDTTRWLVAAEDESMKRYGVRFPNGSIPNELKVFKHVRVYHDELLPVTDRHQKRAGDWMSAHCRTK
jgi:hypothetical protein